MTWVWFLIGAGLGTLFGVPLGVHFRMADERERQERLRRMNRTVHPR